MSVMVTRYSSNMGTCLTVLASDFLVVTAFVGFGGAYRQYQE